MNQVDFDPRGPGGAEARMTLVAVADGPVLHFDGRLQGESETVFLTV
jgi:hypothetical protein